MDRVWIFAKGERDFSWAPPQTPPPPPPSQRHEGVLAFSSVSESLSVQPNKEKRLRLTVKMQIIFINIFQTSCHLQGKNSNIKLSKAQKVIIIIIIIIVISHMSWYHGYYN